MPSPARLFIRFRAAGINGRLDLSLSIRAFFFNIFGLKSKFNCVGHGFSIGRAMAYWWAIASFLGGIHKNGANNALKYICCGKVISTYIEDSQSVSTS